MSLCLPGVDVTPTILLFLLVFVTVTCMPAILAKHVLHEVLFLVVHLSLSVCVCVYVCMRIKD